MTTDSSGAEESASSGRTPPSSLPDHPAAAVRNNQGEALTTDQGVLVPDDQNSLRAGRRGPTLMDDFILREKITHFDHERIPERVVHARGAGAHGYFELYESLSDVTSAAFLQEPGARTPVFVRFSTVVGSRGSADTVRDVRGFATKFYTSEGNFDLVGNNIPVFFIQDAIKFPDVVHAVKPEPDSEMPQAQSAHDTFWDFVWLTPESTHMIMWLMSDRAIPRSYAMMEGFGVHTFKMINAAGEVSFVKFHWKPVVGIHSLVWDEAQKIAGKDPDFNRRDLWESIASGSYPQYEMAVQVIREADEERFEFDVLDPTKVWPEELVPPRTVGRLVLNRNPENFFAETEQVAFHIGNLVPGIDASDDPLLQGRLFSYLDTQLIRLGGPNFTQLPINRARVEVHHNQRDGYHQMAIDRGRTSYSPNSLQGGAPREAGARPGSFVSHAAPVGGVKERVRSQSFDDHFGQAALFYRSMSDIEREHIVLALRFELGKVKTPHVRERVVDLLTNVDVDLATAVATGIGVTPPPAARQAALGQANARLQEGWATYGSTSTPGPQRQYGVDESPALSQLRTPAREPSIRGRRVAILAADGVDAASVGAVIQALALERAKGEVVSLRQGPLTTATGTVLVAEHTVLTQPSVAFDAVFVAGGAESVDALLANGDAVHYVAEAYKHCKPIAASGDGVRLLERTGLPADEGAAEVGVLVATSDAPEELASALVSSLLRHRFFNRVDAANVPA